MHQVDRIEGRGIQRSGSVSGCTCPVLLVCVALRCAKAADHHGPR